MTDTKALGPSNDHIPRREMTLAHQLAGVAARNLRFANAEPAQQRVTIARDVLRWMRNGKLTPIQNEYLTVQDSQEPGLIDGGTCTACALGSMFACAVARAETFRVLAPMEQLDGHGTQPKCIPVSDHSPYGYGWQGAIRAALSPYFSVDQLKEVETAFESSMNTGKGSVDASVYAVGLSAKARMKKIMRNIIRNHGTFVPTDAK